MAWYSEGEILSEQDLEFSKKSCFKNGEIETLNQENSASNAQALDALKKRLIAPAPSLSA